MGVFVESFAEECERSVGLDGHRPAQLQRLKKVVVTFVGTEMALGDLLSSVDVAHALCHELSPELQREDGNGQG